MGKGVFGIKSAALNFFKLALWTNISYHRSAHKAVQPLDLSLTRVPALLCWLCVRVVESAYSPLSTGIWCLWYIFPFSCVFSAFVLFSFSTFTTPSKCKHTQQNQQQRRACESRFHFHHALRTESRKCVEVFSPSPLSNPWIKICANKALFWGKNNGLAASEPLCAFLDRNFPHFSRANKNICALLTQAKSYITIRREV